MGNRQELNKHIAIKKLIKKTSLKNLTVKDFRGSVISRELKKIEIKHPFIYKEIVDYYQQFILNQSNLKFVLAFAQNYKFITYFDVDKIRKKVIKYGSIQDKINIIQAFPEIEMNVETSRVVYDLDKYVDLFGKDLTEWNNAGFSNPSETIRVDKPTGKYKKRTEQEKLFALKRYDNIYFKNCSEEEILKKKTEFLSDAYYKLGLALPNSNIELLGNRIVKLGIEADIIKFANNVKGADKNLVEKFYDEIKKSNIKKPVRDVNTEKDITENFENIL